MDDAGLTEEEKQTVLVAMACPCCVQRNRKLHLQAAAESVSLQFRCNSWRNREGGVSGFTSTSGGG